MTRDELIENAAVALHEVRHPGWSCPGPEAKDRKAALALADAGLLAEPGRVRPMVLLRAEDCDCIPPYADCQHGPEPVDALALALWLHAEAKFFGEGWHNQWMSTRETVHKLQARLDVITETLGAADRMMTSDARDWSLSRSDVWLYGLLVSWECEETHEHDEVMCGGDGALREVAAHRGWAANDIARIRRFRAALQGDQPAEAASFAPVEPHHLIDDALPLTERARMWLEGQHTQEADRG